MYDKDLQFQLIFFFAYGILFGGLSPSIFYSFLFIVVYEFYVFHMSKNFPPIVRELDRILLNVVYIGGWILGRCLMLNETGLETTWDEYLRFEKYD